MSVGAAQCGLGKDEVLESYRLRAAQLASDVWLVSRSLPSNTPDPDSTNDLLRSPQPLVVRAMQLMDATRHLRHAGSVVSLPDWGDPIADRDLARFKLLKNASLILVDHDAEARLGFAALQRFARLRIDRIVYTTMFRDDSAAEIVFNATSDVRRLLSTILLFFRRLVLVSNRRAARGFDPVAFSWSQDARCSTPQLSELDISGDQEQYERYMAFEGLRQLAPVRNTHDSISQHQDGRYSVWSGRFYFAPTDKARLFRSPYWIVENNARNRGALHYYPRRYVDAGVGSARLEPLFDGEHEAIGRKLKVGDVVAVVTHALSPGGAERQWVYLALGLKKAGFDVRFVVYRELFGADAHYVHLLDDADIPIMNLDGVRFRPLRSLANDDPLLWSICRGRVVDDIPYLCRIRDLLGTLRPEAVYVQLDEPNVYVGLAALIAKVPRVITSFRNANPTHFAFNRSWYLDAYKLIARSRRVRLSGNSRIANEDYAAWLDLDPRRITCIPNAVDDAIFREPTADAIARARDELGITPTSRVVLGVFRLSDEKNPSCFLRTVELVAREIGELRALIVGLGPLADAIAKEADERGLSGIVRFLGRRDDVNTLMALSDVLLLTSNHEGLPNVVLEAQLMGLPVVATDVGGTREALEPGRSGLVCPPDDAEALAAACIQILTDRELALEMGRRGTEFIRRGFSLAAMTERYITLADDGGVEVDQPSAAAPAHGVGRVMATGVGTV